MESLTVDETAAGTSTSLIVGGAVAASAGAALCLWLPIVGGPLAVLGLWTGGRAGWRRLSAARAWRRLQRRGARRPPAAQGDRLEPEFESPVGRSRIRLERPGFAGARWLRGWTPVRAWVVAESREHVAQGDADLGEDPMHGGVWVRRFEFHYELAGSLYEGTATHVDPLPPGRGGGSPLGEWVQRLEKGRYFTVLVNPLAPRSERVIYASLEPYRPAALDKLLARPPQAGADPLVAALARTFSATAGIPERRAWLERRLGRAVAVTDPAALGAACRELADLLRGTSAEGLEEARRLFPVSEWAPS